MTGERSNIVIVCYNVSSIVTNIVVVFCFPSSFFSSFVTGVLCRATGCRVTDIIWYELKLNALHTTVQRRQFQTGKGWKLTTEEIIDDRICCTVGVYQPVWEGKPGVHRLSVIRVLKCPEDSAGEQKSQLWQCTVEGNKIVSLIYWEEDSRKQTILMWDK